MSLFAKEQHADATERASQEPAGSDQSFRNPLDSKLAHTDWAAEWIAVQSSHKHLDSPERWDKRAPSFGTATVVSPYTKQFIELLDLEPGDSVFDMGCGNGAVAIPLAQAGWHVTARDFSSGMLGGLKAQAEALDLLDRIDFAQMSWEDDWQAFGVEPKSFDVAFASRSVITQDLGAALRKLSAVARRRACVTVSTGYTPMMSLTILRELGVTAVAAYDYLYTFAILYQLGYYPEIRYIVSDRSCHFENEEMAREWMIGMLEHAQKYCDAEELKRAEAGIDAWVREHMEPNELVGTTNKHGEVEGPYKILVPDDVRWAFISWEV